MKIIFIILLFLKFHTIFSSENPNFDIYLYQNKCHEYPINNIIKSKQFIKVNNKYLLNFGIIYTNRWLKIRVYNVDTTQKYTLKLETITPDSIEVFEFKNKIITSQFIGEGFDSNDRFINYDFKPQSKYVDLYLKIIGNGQPIALPISVIKIENKINYNVIFTGIIYGIILLILIINITLYFSTFEKLYLYIFLYNICAVAVLVYFEGFVKQFLIPHSLYWNNQFVAISLCCSFIITNFYIPEFINLRSYPTILNKLFKISTVIFILLLAISFWHPLGFKIYIVLNLIILSLEALLLFVSVLYVRKKEKKYYLIQLASVLFLVIFGTITQLYFIGILPIIWFTKNVILWMVLPQIFIQTFAIYKRLAMILAEKSTLQADLLKTAERYSQSLIHTLENERSRMASEFHDGIGQNILVIRNRILMMLKRDKLTPQQIEKLDGLALITSETLDELRSIAQDLRPTMLNSIGITASLLHLVDKIKKSTSIKINYSCPKSIDNLLDSTLDINFYRILQELFNNLLKHSQATEANVYIYKKYNHLILEMNDNGIGFDSKNTSAFGFGNGLSGIKERINILKGTILFNNASPGTQIFVKIPIINEK